MPLKFQKGDILAVALVVALALTVALLFIPKTAEGAEVEIYHNGTLVKTMSLSREESYTLEGAYTNVITVRDRKVSVTFSDCPGEDCVHSAPIGATGRSIVCLPNGVEVRIVGKRDDVDFVVG